MFSIVGALQNFPRNSFRAPNSLPTPIYQSTIRTRVRILLTPFSPPIQFANSEISKLKLRLGPFSPAAARSTLVHPFNLFHATFPIPVIFLAASSSRPALVAVRHFATRRSVISQSRCPNIHRRSEWPAFTIRKSKRRSL